MEKFEIVNQLLPYYESLLTQKQVNILRLYYYEDYSLSEIAEELSISRAAIYDTLNKGLAALEEYESKLHLHSDSNYRIIKYNEILAEPEKAKEIVSELIKREDD